VGDRKRAKTKNGPVKTYPRKTDKRADISIPNRGEGVPLKKEIGERKEKSGHRLRSLKKTHGGLTKWERDIGLDRLEKDEEHGTLKRGKKLKEQLGVALSRGRGREIFT